VRNSDSGGVRHLKPLIGTVYLTIVTLSLAWSAIIPAFPQYLGALGAGFSLTGVIIAMKSIGQMASDVPGGFLLARFGIRRISILAYALSVAANLLLMAATSLRFIAVLVFFSGFFTSVLLTAFMAIVRTSVPAAYRGRALSLAGGALRIGMLFGPAIGGFLAQHAGVPAVFLFRSAVLLAGLTSFAVTFRYEPPGTRNTLGIAGQVRAVAHGLRGRWSAVLTVGLGVLVLMILRTSREYILPLWGQTLNLSPSRIGLAISIGAVFDLLLFIPAGFISDRHGRKIAMAVCTGTFSVGLAALALSSGVPGFIFAISLIGVGNGLGAGINMTTGTDLAPKGAISEFLGLWRLYGDLGSSFGPVIVGAVTAVTGPVVSVWTLAAVGAAGVVVMVFFAPETRDM